MSTRKKSSDSFVRCYEVSDPTLHPKGHTIYKITQRTIQTDAPDTNVQEVVVWRRYNDIKRLYKALSHLHQTLHRKEEFPPFSRSKVFGRFDETVIIDRMRSCQDLLNFVGQRSYLVKSKAFLQFFEGGEKLEIDISKCELLKPTTRCQHEVDSWATDTTNSVSLSDMSEDDAGVTRGGSVEVTASSSGDQLGDLLGGVWQYRQSADEISLHDDDDDNSSYLDDGDDTRTPTDVTVDSTPEASLPKADIDLFDPLAGRNVGEENNEYSNAWLLSATPVCDAPLPRETDGDDTDALLEELEKELVTSCVNVNIDTCDANIDSNDTNLSTAVGETFATSDSINTNYVNTRERTEVSSDGAQKGRSRSGSTVECGQGDLVISPVHNAPCASTILPPGGPSPTRSQTKRSEFMSGSPRHQGLVTVDMKQKADYIFQAAHLISLAVQCEASANYFMAFNYYKSGVGILLTGVQLDENEKRRDIVRKKTAKYLMKAESLHSKYLSGGESTDHWDTRLESTENILQPDVAFLRGPVSELANYRVLGVIDKVQLVMDKVTETTYVIKVLYKSYREPVGHVIVPTICPFMVRLYRYYETNSAIYLLLQHATGGHLWSYVSGYLNQAPQSPQFDDHYDRKSPGEELTNIKSETNNKDVNVTQECTESYKKLFTENIVPSSDVGNGNSDATPGSKDCNDVCTNLKSQCRKISDSLGLDRSPDIVTFGSTQHPLVRRISSGKSGGEGAGFGELLKGSDVPVEQFSINSFDSDVTPGGARCSSMTDYIETVPELSESVSPTMSPSKHVVSLADEEVFIDNGLDKHLSKIHKTGNGECVSNSGDANKVMFPSPLHQQGQVSIDEIVSKGTENTVESDDEPSIYDRPQGKTCDTDSLGESNMYIDPWTEKSDDIECSQSGAMEETSSDAQKSATDSQERPHVFRMPSQERSLETHPTGPVRKRSRTGRVRTLSSVFGDLDLADDNEKVESLSSVRLPEMCVRQWIVEMLVAVTKLHRLSIICRDLRPANILLGERGHVTLSYFSQWSCVDSETPNELAVNQLYAAPEVSRLSQEVSEASDWWSLGALMYELITGRSLASCHPSGINSHTCLLIPDHVSPEAQSLLQQLLKFSPSERLGSGSGGVEDIRAHPFFSDVHWPSL